MKQVKRYPHLVGQFVVVLDSRSADGLRIVSAPEAARQGIISNPGRCPYFGSLEHCQDYITGRRTVTIS